MESITLRAIIFAVVASISWYLLSGYEAQVINRNPKCQTTRIQSVISLNTLLVFITAYLCYIARLFCSHISGKVENLKQSQMLQECLESLAFVYFIQNRALQPDNIGQLIELSVCQQYRDDYPGVIFYQWLLIRLGYGVYELWNRRQRVSFATCCITTSLVLIFIIYFSD